MKTRNFFIIGLLLFFTSVFGPAIYRKFVPEPKVADTAELVFICVTALIVILSVAFLIGGILRLISGRSEDSKLKIDSQE
jgi:Na+-driven multidrug efflux pump